MTDDFISLQSVRKTYGSVVAVDSVDLDIAKGSFFSLLGPSGCGKTTLLTMMGGLDFPTSGKIFIDGADVTKTPSYRRPTNMVFQSYAIFPHLNVAENVGYGLQRSGLSKSERTRRVEEMLELVHLGGFGDRKTDQLSGGQMQRVALARALVVKPKVLLLDEPLSALDKRLRQNMQIELRAIQREVGITFVFVTHDQEEALTLSDKIAVMARGQVLQCSSPAELYDRPLSREVAEFVGEMNLIPGRVTDVTATGVSVDMPCFGTRWLQAGTRRFLVGDPVCVAVRPENFYLSEAAEAAPMRVTNRAYFGSHIHLILATDGIDPVCADVPAATARRLGDTGGDGVVSVDFDQDTAVLLPGRE